jgi:multidrug efflux pump subunit AcrB
LNFNLSRWALEHIPLIRYLIVALLLGGTVSYGYLGQDEDPPVTFRLMVVSAVWPGASAAEMAEQVTDKLEKKLQETPLLDKIRSYSKPGETLIMLQLRESATAQETESAWYQVRKKISDISTTLPVGVQGPFFNDEFGDTFGSIFVLYGEGFGYAELKDYAELARLEFLNIPTASKVELFGVQPETMEIEFSEKKFAQFGISFNDIVTQLNERNLVLSAGDLVTPANNIPVRVSGAIKSRLDLENVLLRSNDITIRLGDFATVRRSYADPPHDKMRYNNQDVIGVGISMERGGNIVELGKQLDSTAESIQKSLPAGLALRRIANQPKAVTSSVNEFLETLAAAIAIVLAVSFIALGLHINPVRLDFRPGLVVALTIPLVLAITVIFMRIFHIELNKISLGALIIALGLLVDDAIIAVEMMSRKMDEGLSHLDAATFAYQSTAVPMLTGTLITVAGFLPIGLARSIAGEYTFSMFSVNALALIISWVVAVLFTPYIGFVLLKPGYQTSNANRHLYHTYFYLLFRRAVTRCISWPRTTILITLLVFALGVFAFNFIEQQFFPDSSRAELLVELWLPESSAFSATEAQTRKLEQFILKQPESADVTSYIGTGSPRFYLPLDQIFPQSNVAQMVVVPNNAQDRDVLQNKIREVFKTDFPEVRGRVKLLPNGPPMPYPVQFKVTGADMSKVRLIANQVRAIVRANSYALDVNDNWNESIKVLRLELDQDKLLALKIGSQDVMRAVNTILSGTAIGQYREKNKLIDIIVRQPVNERDTISALTNATIQTNNGRSIPLSQLTNPRVEWEPGVLWRENRQWAITVQADVANGIQGPTVSDQIDPLLDSLRASLPAGYQIVQDGAAADSARAQDSILVNIGLVVFIILTLLMLQLHSFSRAMLVLVTGPLGIIGAGFALLILQRPFGFVAQLGVIALFGMIVRNAIILVDQIEQDIEAGMPAWDAIIESTVRRARPILLTAAAAVLAMIPLSQSVFWGPMAVAIMGGLIVATVLTLLFLPALYAAWFRVKRQPVSDTESA